MADFASSLQEGHWWSDKDSESTEKEVDMLSSSYHRVSTSEPYIAMNKGTEGQLWNR